MVKKQEIKSLMRVCLTALKEAGYTDKCISEYQRKWNKLSLYMEEHSISDYSSDVGDAFMEFISRQRPSFRSGYRRSVFFLSDYLQCGKVYCLFFLDIKKSRVQNTICG